MSVILWLAALVAFVVAALLGFGVFSGAHAQGWLALGLVFVAAAFLVGSVPGDWVRRG